MNLRFTTMTAVAALMLFTPIAGYAQDTPAAPAAAAEAVPPVPAGTVAPSAVDTKTNTYTQQQLDQMLAPIALYPDQLVSQILMASSFPLQIVEAARWLDNPRNAALKGDALVTALQPMNWDPSIKSITAFPAIVTMLNKNLDWTNSLGVAFTRQQTDVMAQIQFLRHQAQKAGNLASNDKIVCRNDGANIVIAPANPRVVYAPHYNPAVVYGTWPWAAYPPVYFSPGYFGLGPLAFGVAWGWGPAWPIVPAFWGWQSMNWGTGGGIYINGSGYSRIAYGNAAWGGGNWQHPGGAISHGSFSGGVTSVGGAAVAVGGRSSAGAVPAGAHTGRAHAGMTHAHAPASRTHAGGGHPGGDHQRIAHGGHPGGDHPGGGHPGGGGHQGIAHASGGPGGGHGGGPSGGPGGGPGGGHGGGHQGEGHPG